MIQAKVKLKIPSLPNFIFIDSEDVQKHSIDVKDLSAKELRQIGREWTEALVKHSEWRKKINQKN